MRADEKIDVKNERVSVGYIESNGVIFSTVCVCDDEAEAITMPKMLYLKIFSKLSTHVDNNSV